VRKPGTARRSKGKTGRSLCELAAKMGYREQFPLPGPWKEIFNESAALTLPTTYVLRASNGLKRVTGPAERGAPCTPILHREKYSHPDGLGVFAPIEWHAAGGGPRRWLPLYSSRPGVSSGTGIPQHDPSVQDARLRGPHRWIEINAGDAKELAHPDGEIVRAGHRRGSVNVPAKVTPDIMRGVMFIAFHFAECPANR